MRKSLCSAFRWSVREIELVELNVHKEHETVLSGSLWKMDIMELRVLSLGARVLRIITYSVQLWSLP
jgi:hypothetical protein